MNGGSDKVTMSESDRVQKYMLLSSSPAQMTVPSLPTTLSTKPRHKNTIEDPRTEDSYRLGEINQQLKVTLTELLNTEFVCSNEKNRLWIQERLMDTEQQIRKQRCRYSSGDHETTASIATYFSPAYSSKESK
ncbi:hypothetical protein DM02DRAFT_619824 [Periconia macrospinosa]|uniref:Uncharacterized protein n=1 Tax=Periconia macrospinosa TaxID=97972 RepID=A0A2V1D3N3_9PLEO|nr:hypothetical protein DM02DRAFT_619824 [Periconia macrospinosa]